MTNLASITNQFQYIIIPSAAMQYSNPISGGYMRPVNQDGDFPLRILVQSNVVGAIIGRSGNTIKQITQQSKARIDVHREESLEQQEKIITINGAPESCSIACFRILEIIQNEKAQMSNNGNLNNVDNTDCVNQDSASLYSEVRLRILAHNNLIGRLIGRNGASIKKIMEQTSTKINISVNSLTDCTNERTITVVGNLEQVQRAEKVISSKLRAAYMSDMSTTLQAINHQPYLFNNVPISYLSGPYAQSPILSNLVNTSGGHGSQSMAQGPPISSHGQMSGPGMYPNSPGYLSLYHNIATPPSKPGLLGYSPAVSGHEPERETVNIYVPSTMVGAIIGKSGSAIKEMINYSGASIKVVSSPAPVNSSTSASKEENPTNICTESCEESKEDDSNVETNCEKQAHDTSNPQPVSKYNNNLDWRSSTRKVTIIGNSDSQWAAQCMIYRKVSSESKRNDVSLMVEIKVPSKLVGKIIGKGGATVKAIQLQTRTTIRLPDERQHHNDDNVETETTVQITGEFQSSQLAQRHIRNLIRESFYSSARQSKLQAGRQNDSGGGKFNAQGGFESGDQPLCENEALQNCDDIYNETSRLVDRSVQDSQSRSEGTPSFSESPSRCDQINIPHEEKSQVSPMNSARSSCGTANDATITSNNNTINKNLNSTGNFVENQSSAKSDEHMSNLVHNDLSDSCEDENHSDKLTDLNSCKKERPLMESVADSVIVNNGKQNDS